MKFELQMRTRNVGIDDYLATYFSEDFNQLALGPAKLKQRVLEHYEILADGCELRRVRMVPDVALPGPVVRLLDGNEVAYHEITRYDPRQRTARLDIESLAGDVIRVGGQVEFTEASGDVLLQFSGDVRVTVFGLGKLIEKIIIKQVRSRYASVEAELQRYVDAGPARH